MTQKIYKVHTDTFGRLVACIQRAMYGVTNTAFKKQMPPELYDARAGDVVFISEREVSKNALFGPFYIVEDRAKVICKSRKGAWVNVDVGKTPPEKIAYWVELEKKNWCLLFDRTLSDRISIVWPYNWSRLRVNLPSWGLVKGDDAAKLMDFALENEIEAREFLLHHDVW